MVRTCPACKGDEEINGRRCGTCKGTGRIERRFGDTRWHPIPSASTRRALRQPSLERQLAASLEGA